MKVYNGGTKYAEDWVCRNRYLNVCYASKRGDLITIDFGINLSGYCTDIQRTAYVLREDEEQPPDYFLKMWETNVKAIEEGF